MKLTEREKWRSLGFHLTTYQITLYSVIAKKLLDK
jgi:hypothetical protein